VTSLAEDERAYLADLLEELGPDQPTLCEGWQTRDLAAHLVLRERRPVAAAGIVFGPLSRHTRMVQDELAAMPWPDLVATLRQRSPLAFGPIDGAINTVEFFVHTEDVRRAQPDWQPRPEVPAFEEVAERMLRARRLRANVSGPASERLLYAYGRKDHALVEVSGPGGPPPAARP
jgi:uncharacterized protein (TIGR03085 family)